MEKIEVFLDTNVVISSILSTIGVSHRIIIHPKISKLITKTVEDEIISVSERLNIDSKKIKTVLKNLKRIELNLTKKNLLKNYNNYVFDQEDSHVVAGAHKSKTKFLLTYNIKHFKIDKINRDFGLIVMTPGRFLQYLRSQ